ncbi:sensor histidine kinase [Aliikangiella coralliicola]|uniref:Signal transduction histidine kinase internal region domain-containing protein n=1 Tax=Aliikangiella coralliicola TaxID=2592383 RepID=A0A545UFU0_9GAMM|nr:histidine kinase [Aliikangiella coralliicola]TQV88346.1 hypothetical protein FLL46_07415 [Aliikangiella coralliicola]
MLMMVKDKSNLRTFLLVLSIWSIIAIIAATTAFIALEGKETTLWLKILKPMLVYYYVWGFYSFVIFQIVLQKSSALSKPLIQLTLHLLSALFITTMQARIVYGEDWQDWLLGESSRGFWLLCGFIYLFIFIVALLIKRNHQLKAKDKETAQMRLRSSQLENQLSLAQIDALKMQINPHFLFNALNSIAALIELESNQQAYRTTELLGDLLRSTLIYSSESQISLRDELIFVNRYIELEQVRFADRFKFHQDIDPAAENAQVPALILQPLIENSFKHGISQSKQLVEIKLTIKISDTKLMIELHDNAATCYEDHSIEEGYGLSNIRKRLALMYNNKAVFNFSRGDKDGFCNELVIPFKNINH